MAYQNKKRNSVDEPRINDEIYHYGSVRLVYSGDDEDEAFNKVVTMGEARRLSEDKTLDLIEVNAKENPPIVRLANYSKYMYELKRQMKQRKKQASANSVKEIQLKTNISDHDIEIKANRARGFIEDGDKVRVVLSMKGRELSRREVSKTCIYKFIDIMGDCAVAESMPRDEGNKSIVILKKKG